jgi:hypothetical protein
LDIHNLKRLDVLVETNPFNCGPGGGGLDLDSKNRKILHFVKTDENDNNQVYEARNEKVDKSFIKPVLGINAGTFTNLDALKVKVEMQIWLMFFAGKHFYQQQSAIRKCYKSI